MKMCVRMVFALGLLISADVGVALADGATATGATAQEQAITDKVGATAREPTDVARPGSEVAPTVPVPQASPVAPQSAPAVILEPSANGSSHQFPGSPVLRVRPRLQGAENHDPASVPVFRKFISDGMTPRFLRHSEELGLDVWFIKLPGNIPQPLLVTPDGHALLGGHAYIAKDDQEPLVYLTGLFYAEASALLIGEGSVPVASAASPGNNPPVSTSPATTSQSSPAPAASAAPTLTPAPTYQTTGSALRYLQIPGSEAANELPRQNAPSPVPPATAFAPSIPAPAPAPVPAPTLSQVQAQVAQPAETIDAPTAPAPTLSQVSQAQPTAHLSSARLMKAFDESHWIEAGQPNAPLMYVVVDPGCQYCKNMWKAMRGPISAGLVRVRLIISTPLGAGSVVNAVTILSSSDPIAVWDTLVEEGKIKTLAADDSKATMGRQLLAINNQMRIMNLDSVGVRGVPLLFYRDRATGKLGYLLGIKAPEVESLVASVLDIHDGGLK